MAGERRLNRDLGRLEIARLAHHDAVRVLAQKRTERAREGEADRFVHRHLHDAFEIVFDRFLRGEQLRIDRVDLAQTGIKRRRFSRAGRPGYDENSVRAIDDLDDVIAHILGRAEHLEIEIHDTAIEDAQYYALAELRGQSRDAEIHAATGDIFLDATILRQSALSDVHARHHFHARDYR